MLWPVHSRNKEILVPAYRTEDSKSETELLNGRCTKYHEFIKHKRTYKFIKLKIMG
jgi:hypothetical protein